MKQLHLCQQGEKTIFVSEVYCLLQSVASRWHCVNVQMGFRFTKSGFAHTTPAHSAFYWKPQNNYHFIKDCSALCAYFIDWLTLEMCCLKTDVHCIPKKFTRQSSSWWSSLTSIAKGNMQQSLLTWLRTS